MFMISLSVLPSTSPAPHLQNACGLVQAPSSMLPFQWVHSYPHLMQPTEFKLCKSPDLIPHKRQLTDKDHISHGQATVHKDTISHSHLLVCGTHKIQQDPSYFSRCGHSYHAFLNMRWLWRRTVTTPGSEQGLQGPLFAPGLPDHPLSGPSGGHAGWSHTQPATAALVPALKPLLHEHWRWKHGKCRHVGSLSPAQPGTCPPQGGSLTAAPQTWLTAVTHQTPWLLLIGGPWKHLSLVLLSSALDPYSLSVLMSSLYRFSRLNRELPCLTWFLRTPLANSPHWLKECSLSLRTRQGWGKGRAQAAGTDGMGEGLDPTGLGVGATDTWPSGAE